MDEWQPIETAPQDGFFFVYGDGAMRCLMRIKGEWSAPHYAYRLDGWGGKETDPEWKVSLGVFDPSHWMPLPEPPPEATDG